VLTQTSSGELAHFPLLGAASILFALACVYLARFLKLPERSEGTIEPVPVES
jgi:hypothetical protein